VSLLIKTETYLVSFQMVLFLMTLSDLEATFHGFNDRHSRAASLRQLSFL